MRHPKRFLWQLKETYFVCGARQEATYSSFRVNSPYENFGSSNTQLKEGFPFV